MPSWSKLLQEVEDASRILDLTRLKYLKRLHEKTGRNVIVYYSAWLQKSHQRQIPGFEVNDSDKNGLMATIHELEKKKGLDLILHTPGGAIAATESFVYYLRAIFGTNIRVFVPQIAMSAGTMIALAAREIFMGKHSNLGPVDPQIFGLPAHAIVEEFERAKQEVGDDPKSIPIWQPIIAKYTPTMIGEAEKAISWAQEIVKDWLMTGMFEGDSKAEGKADKVLEQLGDPAISKSHARHIDYERAEAMGLKVTALEKDQELQEAVLTVHHACILTLAQTSITKLIENHNGVSHISRIEIAK